MKKYIAECLGTFILVLLGCGSAVLAGAEVGQLGISFAFGLALIIAAYTIGSVSGCHINPAVSLGVYCAGRMDAKDLAGYIVAQFVGACLGAAVLLVIVKAKSAGYDVAAGGLGQNGYGPDYLGGYGLVAAIVFEFVATFLFVSLILNVTAQEAQAAIAGLIIGLALVAIHIVGIQVTGVSVNPARSFGPALFAGSGALSALPVFLIVPSVAGIVAGVVNRAKVLND